MEEEATSSGSTQAPPPPSRPRPLSVDVNTTAGVGWEPITAAINDPSKVYATRGRSIVARGRGLVVEGRELNAVVVVAS